VIELDPARGGQDGASFALEQRAAELQDERVVVENQHGDIGQRRRHAVLPSYFRVCGTRLDRMIHFPAAATTWTNSISPRRRPLLRPPSPPRTRFRSAVRLITTRVLTAISVRCF